jgi:hypothetical protein
LQAADSIAASSALPSRLLDTMSTAIFEREAVHRIAVRIFMNFSHHLVKKRARAGRSFAILPGGEMRLSKKREKP